MIAKTQKTKEQKRNDKLEKTERRRNRKSIETEKQRNRKETITHRDRKTKRYKRNGIPDSVRQR